MRYPKLRKSLSICLVFYTSSQFGLALAQQPSGSIQSTLPFAGQDLSLFEEVETSTARPGVSDRPTRESRVTTSEPEFVLIGASRIVDNYSVILQHKSGESLIVKPNSTGNTVIDEYSSYSIVNVSAGSVSIRYPSNSPCVDFPDRGVRCNSASNIADLVLANGEPLASRIPLEPSADQVASDEGSELNPESPVNPFEALRNGGVSQADNNNGNRFTPRRINPEDVPEGMRIIATPFGDRLVEQ